MRVPAPGCGWKMKCRTLPGCSTYHHQGRAAERIIYGHLGGPGKVFISNTHFDTTRANIEFSGATAIDIPIVEGQDTALQHPFKGNMDVGELDRLLKEHKGHIGAVILTVTNNSGGGQPVSMANAEGVSAICKRHGVILMLDCCRIAENSWFVKHREEGMEGFTYREIAQRMFALADGAVMSAKKDAFANIGGFLSFRDEALAEACINLLIITGDSPLRRMAARYGSRHRLEEIFDALPELPHPGTTFLGEQLTSWACRSCFPIGARGIHDAKKLYPHIPPSSTPARPW